jgi:hypothetical protein
VVVEATAARRLTPWRVALLAVVVGLTAMWIYVLLPNSARAPINRLDSNVYGRTAEPVCARALAAINVLPRADTAKKPADRARLIAQADGHLRTMLDELARVTPGTGRDAGAVDRWLADWHTYLADREAWAAQLRAGDDSQFLETEVEGGPISVSIDDFADANRMSSCRTPYDV